MADRAPPNVSGSTFGSFAWLYLGVAIPCVAFFLVLGIVKRNVGMTSALVVGTAIGLWFVSHFVQRVSTIVVTEDGVSYRYGVAPRVQAAVIDVVLPWDNIRFVQQHVFSASVILEQPQQIGLFKRRKLRFAYLDPHWRERPTSIAIMRRCHQQRLEIGRTDEGTL